MIVTTMMQQQNYNNKEIRKEVREILFRYIDTTIISCIRILVLFMTRSFCEQIFLVGNLKFYQMYIIGSNFVNSIYQCNLNYDLIEECKFLYFFMTITF